jgi:hypothetical protein
MAEKEYTVELWKKIPGKEKRLKYDTLTFP